LLALFSEREASSPPLRACIPDSAEKLEQPGAAAKDHRVSRLVQNHIIKLGGGCS